MVDRSGRQLYRNTLTTDFAQGLQNGHKNISDAVQQNRSAFLNAHAGYRPIRKMHFHLPLFHLTLYRTFQKPLKASVKTFAN